MKTTIQQPLPYALARLHARLSGLLDVSDWDALQPVEGVGPFLEAACKGPMAEWLTGLDASSDAHAVERGLRHRFEVQVEELARWMPLPWRAGLRWVGLLPYLAVFAYLDRREQEQRWMREDMTLFPYLAPSPSELPPAERLAPPALPSTWLNGWQARLPESRAADPRLSARLGAALLDAAGLPTSVADQDSRRVRVRRMSSLRRLFHHVGCSPLAAFAYLGLVLVAFDSLRAELQRRLLFPPPGSGS